MNLIYTCEINAFMKGLKETAVQIGTGNFIKPDICIDIINGLEDYVKKEKLKSITEIVGII